MSRNWDSTVIEIRSDQSITLKYATFSLLARNSTSAGAVMANYQLPGEFCTS